MHAMKGHRHLKFYTLKIIQTTINSQASWQIMSTIQGVSKKETFKIQISHKLLC